MKKVFAWILSILSLVLLALFVLFLLLFILNVNTAVKEDYMSIFMGCIFVAILAGTSGHLLAERKTFPYIVTFPTYGVFFVILMIGNGIKALFYGLLKLLGYMSENSSSDRSDETQIFLINDNGYERKLQNLGNGPYRDYEAPQSSPYYGEYYNWLIDDTGSRWRSYDGNKTFVKENTLKNRGWKI